MGIMPLKYLADLSRKLKVSGSGKPVNGWLALSPLLVFLVIYAAASIIAGDFYKVPITSAFLISTIYAFLITSGEMDVKISVFSDGAGNRNVLLMIWVFILAGAFANTAKDIGAIEATVNLTLTVMPEKLIYAGLFLASCFISMAIGTSVGTIVALVPVGTAIAQEMGAGVPYMTAIIAGGAFFGDNLSFISDTTIAATRTQGCSMADKFKANFAIVAPAAVIVTAVYVFQGLSVGHSPEIISVDWVKLIPYILVIGLALTGVNVVSVLVAGIACNLIIGLSCGSIGIVDFLVSMGGGISGMGELIIVTMVAGGLLEIIRSNGGLDFIISGLTRKIKGKRGAELSVALLVSLVNFCTANNTIAIITSGPIAKNISEKYALNPRKVASILDTFSCLVQGIIPYGAQMLMASGLAGVSAAAIIGNLFYPFTMGIFAFLAILFRYPRKYS